MGVAFIDVDGLKTVNDTHGHAAGDALITSAAHTLTHIVDPAAFVARISGDEFVVVLTGPAADQIGDYIRIVQTELDNYGIPVSVGWATTTENHSGTAENHSSTSFEQLLDRADHMMFADKQHRRQSRPQEQLGERDKGHERSQY